MKCFVITHCSITSIHTDSSFQQLTNPWYTKDYTTYTVTCILQIPDTLKIVQHVHYEPWVHRRFIQHNRYIHANCDWNGTKKIHVLYINHPRLHHWHLFKVPISSKCLFSHLILRFIQWTSAKKNFRFG